MIHCMAGEDGPPDHTRLSLYQLLQRIHVNQEQLLLLVGVCLAWKAPASCFAYLALPLHDNLLALCESGTPMALPKLKDGIAGDCFCL
jgi:hypothetical protein